MCIRDRLTIKGDGTLTANGGNVTNGVSYGINVESYTRSVSVMVENSNIISKGGITDGIYLNVSYGIYAFSFYDSVLVTAIDGGSIYATGNNLEGEQSNSYGISAISNYGSVEIISRNGEIGRAHV